MKSVSWCLILLMVVGLVAAPAWAAELRVTGFMDNVFPQGTTIVTPSASTSSPSASASAPGHGATPPGQGGTPPGQAKQAEPDLDAADATGLTSSNLPPCLIWAPGGPGGY
jgi:hypothetical protein